MIPVDKDANRISFDRCSFGYVAENYGFTAAGTEHQERGFIALPVGGLDFFDSFGLIIAESDQHDNRKIYIKKEKRDSDKTKLFICHVFLVSYLSSHHATPGHDNYYPRFHASRLYRLPAPGSGKSIPPADNRRRL
jgi:hypothetical protein